MMCPFFNHSFDIVVVDFDLSLSVGDKFILYQSDDSGTVSSLLGLDRIFK